jgi:polysaccharide biosynthesis transport protein
MDSSKEKPLITLKDYIAIARRRLWWLVIPLVLGWAMVLSAAWFVPPRYRSETVIIVEQQKVPEQYVLPNVAADLQQRLQSMTQQILSRTRLLGIIENLQLYGGNTKQRDPDVLVQQMRSDIKIDMVQAPGRPWELSAFKISYSAPYPALAQQVTSRLSSLFIEENRLARTWQIKKSGSVISSRGTWENYPNSSRPISKYSPAYRRVYRPQPRRSTKQTSKNSTSSLC